MFICILERRIDSSNLEVPERFRSVSSVEERISVVGGGSASPIAGFPTLPFKASPLNKNYKSQADLVLPIFVQYPLF